MAVTLNDVRHVAALARLGLSDAKAAALVGELNTILGHMDVLSKVDTTGRDSMTMVGATELPLQADHGPCVPLEHELKTFAPSARDGFLLVPRLATHETGDES